MEVQTQNELGRPRATTPDKRAYLHSYYTTHRKTGQVLLAQEIADWEKDWTAARQKYPDHVACFLCNPPRAFKRLPDHFRTEHPGVTGENFRRQYNLNKNTPLASLNFCNAMAKEKNASRWRPPLQTRFGQKQGPEPQKGVNARKQWGVSQQAKQNISRALKGKPRPNFRKKDRVGRSIPNWAVVEPRLRGEEARDVAVSVTKKYGISISASAVVARWRTVGLPPGKPCLIDRGQAVTEERLRAHWEDMKIVWGGKAWAADAMLADGQQEELVPKTAAQLLGVPVMWVYDRVRDRANSPIPHFKRGGSVLFRAADLRRWAAGLQHGKSLFRSRDAALTELAGRLRVGIHRIREFLVQNGGPLRIVKVKDARGELALRENRRQTNYLLSYKLASTLVQNAEPLLRAEWKRLGASREGGHPEVYLPSEKITIPREYEELMSDCRLLLEWTAKVDAKPTIASVGEWMCEQHGRGNLKAFLLWPKLHREIVKVCQEFRAGRRHMMPLAERVKGWLIEEHGGSIRTIERVITKSRKGVA